MSLAYSVSAKSIPSKEKRLKNASESVIQCLRHFINSGNVDDWALPAEPEQWDPLIHLADALSVMPIVSLFLAKLPLGTIPADKLEELRERSQRHAYRSLALTGELLRVSGLLDAAGIHFVPIKGPTLAAAVYGDPSLRAFQDLDILVKPEDLLRARDILVQQGYTMSSAVHWNSGSANFRSVNCEFSMWRDGISIDLHWRLLPPHIPFRLDTDDLWSGLATQKMAGRQIPTLSAEHQLLYLAAHGAKHGWSKLRWVCDFARCVQVTPIDWPRAFQLCGKAGNILVLTHALALVQQLLGVHLPLEAEQRVDAGARRIAAEVSASLLHGNPTEPNGASKSRLLMQLTDGPFGALRCWWSVVFTPTEAEWSLVQLPPAAYWLYYPLRIGRLAVKHSIGRLWGHRPRPQP